MKHECPCCGYETFDEPAVGTFDICELCGWEADSVQSTEPDYEGGPNSICLREAQHEFIRSNEDTSGYVKSANWELLDPPSRKSRLANSKADFIVSKNGVTKSV